jgi:tetratricopeptide (TPR) repeat protein
MICRPGRTGEIPSGFGVWWYPKDMSPGAPDLPTALRQAQEWLASDPAEAARRAKAILKAAPRHPAATLLLARARRRQGALTEARALIAPLAKAEPRNAAVQLELGEVLAGLGRPADAVASLRRAVAARPDLAVAWRALGDLLFLSGDLAAADEAYGRYVAAPIGEPLLAQAASAIAAGRMEDAQAALRRRLAEHPHDVKALTMLADTHLGLKAFAEAAVLLEAVLERHPGYVVARHGRAYAQLMLRQPTMDVVNDLRLVLGVQPDNTDARTLLGGALGSLGDAGGAAEAFEICLRARPHEPALLVAHADQLKYSGRRDDAIAGYRRAIALAPRHGEAWFRLGDVKTYRFTPAEEDAMSALLAADGVEPQHRVFIHYALARARDDAGSPAEAIAHYTAGAALQHALEPYDSTRFTAFARRCEALFTPSFFEARRGAGRPDADPIFIVGLPRAGSTLVEQILASHSQVEGTTELPYIGLIAQRLSGALGGEAYPDLRATLDASNRSDLGEAYLEAARGHRRLGRPRFIDKQPENFQHIGLIHLTLPNARIIDVRRHPMASGLGVFRQHFGSGRAYTYDLGDIGLYYRTYVDLMASCDAALPGRVHRVIYDDMVNDPETEIRRLLDHCGLPFEPACLNFHENSRAVMTPSAEQVRRPIYRDGIDQWRAHEPWLDPLKEALGPALEHWRG